MPALLDLVLLFFVVFGVRKFLAALRQGAPSQQTAPPQGRAPAAVELEKCQICGAFSPTGLACGRPDCPRR